MIILLRTNICFYLIIKIKMSQFMSNTDNRSNIPAKDGLGHNDHFLQCLQCCDCKQQAENDKLLTDLIQKDKHKIKYSNQNISESKFIKISNSTSDYSSKLCSPTTTEPSSAQKIKTKRSLHQHHFETVQHPILQVQSQKQESYLDNYQKHFVRSQSVPKFDGFMSQHQNHNNQMVSCKLNQIHFAYQNPETHFPNIQYKIFPPQNAYKNNTKFTKRISQVLNESQESTTSIQNLAQLYKQYQRTQLMNSIYLNKLSSNQTYFENKKIASKVDFGPNMLIRQVISIREPQQLDRQQSYVITDGNSNFKRNFLNPYHSQSSQKEVVPNMMTSWQHKNKGLQVQK